MKLIEIVELPPTPTRLDELNLKQAVVGGAFTLGTLMSPHMSQLDPIKHTTPTVSAEGREEMNQAMLANTILKKYRGVSPQLAKNVVSLAQKYEKSSFPKADDILAIVGIESSFRPNVLSALKKDPAVGLMQVRPGIWELDPARLSSDIEYQIKSGAAILHKYYKLLGNAEDAVHAYNVGMGNFRRGKHNIKYVHKYKNEKQLYTT